MPKALIGLAMSRKACSAPTCNRSSSLAIHLAKRQTWCFFCRPSRARIPACLPPRAALRLPGAIILLPLPRQPKPCLNLLRIAGGKRSAAPGMPSPAMEPWKGDRKSILGSAGNHNPIAQTTINLKANSVERKNSIHAFTPILIRHRAPFGFWNICAPANRAPAGVARQGMHP
jgi:hypothetical protein